jgi:hypothetical protein
MGDRRSDLVELLFGFFPAQVLQVAARLGIADQLAGGGRTVDELATATGTHAPSLVRLLRALVILGVAAEPEPGRFELTEAGTPLRADVPGSIRNLAMLFCGPEVWRSWGNLEESVRSGRPAWEALFGPPFEYMAANPEFSAMFNQAMSEGTRVAAAGIVEAGAFSRFSTIVDVGGGDGTLLSTILAATPTLQGILFDTPDGLKQAPPIERCTLVAGDFFDAVPEGADAYLLKSVIHDWDDERSVAILANCLKAMPADGTLLLVEPVLPPRIGPSPDAYYMVMSDLNMLVCTGGRERTEQEFRTLLDVAGFALRSITLCPGPTNYSVIEARPA